MANHVAPSSAILPSTAQQWVITVQGRLDQRWSAWFDGLEVLSDPHGNTCLSGVLPDQAALWGVLLRVRDLGLVLLSVTPAQR